MSPIEEMKRNSTVPDVRASEIMAAAGARELHDGEVVIVGLGLPEIATVLAKRTHAPGLATLLAVGVMNPIPQDTPIGLGDSRIFYRSTCWSSYLDVMGMNLHRGVVDVGFLGALEVDRYGSINTTLLKQDAGKVRYVNGSAGGNDVASLAKRVIVIMRHEKRKLPLAVAHLTSPGFVGGHSRKELALRGGGPHREGTCPRPGPPRPPRAGPGPPRGRGAERARADVHDGNPALEFVVARTMKSVAHGD